MRTTIETKKLIVISDLHLSNPISNAKGDLIRFVKECVRRKVDLCINGDVLDIAQASFTKLMEDVPSVFRSFKEANDNGLKIYYIVGNHDIVLEHFLDSWGPFELVPFLNVHSGEKRIRIEHGHLYDPFFVKFPVLYELATSFAGFWVKLHPWFYFGYMKFEKYLSTLWGGIGKGIPGEHPNFPRAARTLVNRGFDHVIFGHTHHGGKREIKEGCWYYNTGSWIGRCPYLEIDNGDISWSFWK